MICHEQIIELYERKFVLASCSYYEFDTLILSDAEFDAISDVLLKNYALTSLIFRERISIEDLKCGSGFALTFTEQERQFVMKVLEFQDKMLTELQKYWPNLDVVTAKAWMWDYALCYCVDESEFTDELACDLVREYVAGFGEC